MLERNWQDWEDAEPLPTCYSVLHGLRSFDLCDCQLQRLPPVIQVRRAWRRLPPTAARLPRRAHPSDACPPFALLLQHLTNLTGLGLAGTT